MFSLCIFCERFLLPIVWSSYKWTGTDSGMSVICSWSKRTESGTLYMPTLDCNLLSYWCWKCRIRALTVRRHKIFTPCHSIIKYFHCCDWCEVWFIWNKQKQHSKCYTWTESRPKKCFETKRRNVGPEMSRTRT